MREIGIGFRASSSTRFAVSTDAITFERLCVCSHESSQRHFFVSSCSTDEAVDGRILREISFSKQQ